MSSKKAKEKQRVAEFSDKRKKRARGGKVSFVGAGTFVEQRKCLTKREMRRQQRKANNKKK